MRFIHISDLHIGKRVNEFSMAEDQKFILNQKPHLGLLLSQKLFQKSFLSQRLLQNKKLPLNKKLRLGLLLN